MSAIETPANTSSPKPSQTYTGGCHCGRFKYEVTCSPPLADSEVFECNCSICSRNGYILTYVDDSAINFEKGSIDEYSEHLSANKKYGHYFCPSCGSSCFAGSHDEGPWATMKAVNVRMLQDVDLKGLKIKEIDGKSR
ncbi:Mss4-like protein [Lophiotrema nucula]|uniref:Mss4-like protein n=1 Tax=Lophiotrema nucula TaxID=690887 RepID=A0A6A5ZGF1_9PLEO|nr:Mss4-like protein [Lophiotrema nucula]